MISFCYSKISNKNCIKHIWIHTLPKINLAQKVLIRTRKTFLCCFFPTYICFFFCFSFLCILFSCSFACANLPCNVLECQKHTFSKLMHSMQIHHFCFAHIIIEQVIRSCSVKNIRLTSLCSKCLVFFFFLNAFFFVYIIFFLVFGLWVLVFIK